MACENSPLFNCTPIIRQLSSIHPRLFIIFWRMHRVLQIPEVLLNIFCHIVPSRLGKEPHEDVDCDLAALAALARTCRAFKEPALDILWSELDDPSPLIQCLPAASQGSSRRHQIARKTAPNYNRRSRPYSSTRPLKRTDWHILRSYARRVWHLSDLEEEEEFDWKFVTRTSSDLTPAEPLFPNLRSLHCTFTEEIIPLLHLPFPSLIRLHICLTTCEDLFIIPEPLKSLAKTSPNIKRLDILCEDDSEFSEDESEYIEIISDTICGWSNLQSVTCPQIPLDVNAFLHLSRLPSLARLTFMLSDTFLDWTALSGSLSFSALNHLKLHAKSLAPISRFLSSTRFPAITHFTVTIDSRPSKQDLTLFMAGIQVVGMDQTIQEFNLNQVHHASYHSDTPLLDLDDLRPCMAFHCLRHMNLDLEWDVNLSDDELLMLGLACPRLEELLINVNWGWHRPGITPNGLALLLETCPSLTSIALVIDTRGYTQMPARQFREPVSPSSFKRPFRLNVLDSVIERESVNALAAFFASVVPHFDFILTSRKAGPVLDDRWEDVHNQATEVIKKRWLNILCGLLFPS